MSSIESTARGLAGELKKNRADYSEARFEESQTSHITYRGKGLESIGRATARAATCGPW